MSTIAGGGQALALRALEQRIGGSLTYDRSTKLRLYAEACTVPLVTFYGNDKGAVASPRALRE